MPSVFLAVNEADVATVSRLSGHDLNSGLELLALYGFDAQGDTPVSALTGGDRGQQMQLIRALFQE
ncbi:MAG: hypothetical protein ACWA49_01090 [Ruegeria sp.]